MVVVAAGVHIGRFEAGVGFELTAADGITLSAFLEHLFEATAAFLMYI